MSNTDNSQNIVESLEKVEHPAIATTLLNLGMLRGISVTSDKKVTLTMILPFPSIPDNVRDYMVLKTLEKSRTTIYTPVCTGSRAQNPCIWGQKMAQKSFPEFSVDWDNIGCKNINCPKFLFRLFRSSH